MYFSKNTFGGGETKTNKNVKESFAKVLYKYGSTT